MDKELTEKLTSFSGNVGLQLKALRTLVNGNKLTLAELQTGNKSNLVAAINEVLGVAEGAALENVDVVVADYFVLHPQTFIYDQIEPSNAWLILHPLDHNPSVVVTDSSGNVWVGQVSYPAPNQVLIQFNVFLTGKAILT